MNSTVCMAPGSVYSALVAWTHDEITLMHRLDAPSPNTRSPRTAIFTVGEFEWENSQAMAYGHITEPSRRVTRRQSACFLTRRITCQKTSCRSGRTRRPCCGARRGEYAVLGAYGSLNSQSNLRTYKNNPSKDKLALTKKGVSDNLSADGTFH